jgi:hypothetical protein
MPVEPQLFAGTVLLVLLAAAAVLGGVGLLAYLLWKTRALGDRVSDLERAVQQFEEGRRYGDLREGGSTAIREGPG